MIISSDLPSTTGAYKGKKSTTTSTTKRPPFTYTTPPLPAPTYRPTLIPDGPDSPNRGFPNLKNNLGAAKQSFSNQDSVLDFLAIDQ